MVVGSPLGGRVAARVGAAPAHRRRAGPDGRGRFLDPIHPVAFDTGYGALWLPSAMMGFGVGLLAHAHEPRGDERDLARPRRRGFGDAGHAERDGRDARRGRPPVQSSTSSRPSAQCVEGQARPASRPRAQGPDPRRAAGRHAPGQAARCTRSPGPRAPRSSYGVREAFVSSLGTSLKVSAGLILLGLLLSTVLMRGSSAADARASPPVPGAPTPRPAPRRMA